MARKREIDPEVKKRYADNYLRKTRLRLDAWKDVPCTDCGNKYPPECMDFDHVRGEKKFNIGSWRNSSLALLEAEIAKCEIVCANCHRIRTRNRKLGVMNDG